MAVVGEKFRVNYTAKNNTPGLTDVYMVVVKPDGSLHGIFTLSEYTFPAMRGTYFYDYDEADIQGSYIFKVWCGSVILEDRKQEYFYSQFSEAQQTEMLSDIQFLVDVSGGRWDLTSPNRLTLRKADNTTIVAEFDTFDIDGNPSIENIMKVVRV